MKETTGVGVFSKSYRQKQFYETVLSLGQVTFSRQEMYDKLHNGHVVAAQHVGKVLRRMDVTTVAGILRIPATDWARVERFGEASLRVLLDLLVYGSVSDSSINKWLTANLTGNKLVQWDSICRQAAKKARKRGKHAA